MSDEKLMKLSQDFAFEVISRHDDYSKVVRIATGWDTKEEDIDALIERL